MQDKKISDKLIVKKAKCLLNLITYCYCFFMTCVFVKLDKRTNNHLLPIETFLILLHVTCMTSFQDLSEDVKEEPASPENGDSESCNTGTGQQEIVAYKSLPSLHFCFLFKRFIG